MNNSSWQQLYFICLGLGTLVFGLCGWALCHVGGAMKKRKTSKPARVFSVLILLLGIALLMLSLVCVGCGVWGTTVDWK